MKNMFLIVKKDGKKYWTKSYEKKDGLLIFSIETKDKKVLPFEVSMDVIDEISSHELKDDDVEL